MKNFIKKYSDYLLIAFLITIAAVIIFYHFIFNGVKFEIIADQQLQYQLFYEEWVRMVIDFIKTGKFPFYSFNTFLGSDFFSSKMYYVVGDIFLPIIIASGNINRALLLITILLLYISAFTINILLKHLGIKNKYVRVTFSIAYALSGIASLYFGNYMFHRFYALMPLLFVGTERYLEYNKKGLFALMVFVLFLQNYYFMFPTTLFLIIYFICSYSVKKGFNIKNIILNALPLIGVYLIGLLASSIILIPTIQFLSNNNRVGESASGILWNIKVYIGYFFSLITPAFNINTKIPYMFYHGFNGHAHWYSVYTGSIGALLLSTLFFIKDRIAIILKRGYLILVLFLFILPLNSIMHGFSEPSFRWVFILVFAQCIIGAYVLDNINKYKKILNMGYILLTVIITAAFITGLLTSIINISEHYITLTVTLISVILAGVNVLLIHKSWYKLVIILITVELTASCFTLVKLYSDNYYYYEPSLNKEYVQYFKDMDEPLHRIYINPDNLLPSSSMNLNQSLYYEYMSTCTYDSTYEYVLNDFLRWNGYNWHIINLNNPEIMKLLGVKYVGVINEDYLDTENSYTYDHNLNHIAMYKIDDYNHLGHSFSETIRKSDFEEMEDKSSFNWNEILIVEDEDFDKLQVNKNDKAQFNIEISDNNYFYGNIEVEDNSILFISVPYSKGWRVSDDSGNILETYNVDGGFMGIYLETGKHYIAFSYTPPNFKLSAIMTITGLLIIVGLIILDFRKKEDHHGI